MNDNRGRTIVKMFVLLALCPLLAGSCSGVKKGARDFRVGLIAPMSGQMSDLGASVLEGANLAIGEKNDEGGLLLKGKAYRVVLVTKDSEDRPEVAVKCAKELINRENIAAIIGPPISGLAIPVAQIASEALVPMITQISTHPDVTKNTRCVYRVCFTDDFQGKVMAKFARGELRARRAAVLYDVANTYNRDLAALFKNTFMELGGEIVSFESYTTGETDFTPQILRIKSSVPHVLFLPNYPNEILLQVEQVRKLGLALRIVGSDTMSFRNSEKITKIEGAYFSTHFSPEIPSDDVQAFVASYRKTFGRQPTAGAALTYDAFGLLFKAVKQAQSVDPPAVCKALGDVLIYSGVTGIMKFDGSPDPVKTAVIVKVLHGEVRYHAQIDP